MTLKRSINFVCTCILQIALSHSAIHSFRQSSRVISSMSGGIGGSLDRNLEYSFGEGFEHIIGVDEAGRGPLAGPVVVAACYIPRSMSNRLDAVIQDSKKMTEEQREHGYEVLMRESQIKYAVSIVSHIEIDELNILQASLTGMRRATVELLGNLQSDTKTNGLKALKSKSSNSSSDQFDLSKCIALVDGNKVPADMPVECKAIVKGDSRIFSIAAASIIAKVVRDRIMIDLHKEYPQYNFAQHKGYPTAEHRSLLMMHGPCPHHRRSYGPVKLSMEAMDKKASKVTKDSTSSVNNGTEVSSEDITLKRKRKTIITPATEEDQPTKKSKTSITSKTKKPESKRATKSKLSTSDLSHGSLEVRRSARLQENGRK